MHFLPLSGAALASPVALIVVNIISWILNGTFLVSLWYKKKLGLTYNRGDIFVINIALVDWLVTCRFMWQTVFITGADDFVCFLDAVWTVSFLGSEMCLLGGLAVERYLGVVKGIRVSRKMIGALLAASWACGIALDGLLGVFVGPYGLNPAKSGCTIYWWDAHGTSAWIGTQLLVIWAVMIYVYWRVWKVSSNSMQAVNTTRETERALALRLFLIVFLFLFCWSPQMVVFFMCASGVTEPAWLSAISGVLLGLNTIVDPVLFLWISPDNRKSMISLLTCAAPLSGSKHRKFTARGSSGKSTQDNVASVTREASPSRGSHCAPASPANSPPASPTGPAPAEALAGPVPMPLLVLGPTSSDPAAPGAEPAVQVEVNAQAENQLEQNGKRTSVGNVEDGVQKGNEAQMVVVVESAA